MKDNISPEEKLLKLIKENKKPASEKITFASATKPAIKHSSRSFPDKYLTPVYIQKVTGLLLAISIAYLISSFIYPWVSLKKIKLPAVSSEKLKLEGPNFEIAKEARPYEFYLQGLGQRQIFSSQASPGGAAALSAADADLIKDINLVGIISGDNPQAVIEDKKIQKTYYLNKGQFMGELQIEDIREGKIILNYKGQRYELYL